jgi:hypothetical protein
MIHAPDCVTAAGQFQPRFTGLEFENWPARCGSKKTSSLPDDSGWNLLMKLMRARKNLFSASFRSLNLENWNSASALLRLTFDLKNGQPHQSTPNEK